MPGRWVRHSTRDVDCGESRHYVGQHQDLDLIGLPGMEASIFTSNARQRNDHDTRLSGRKDPFGRCLPGADREPCDHGVRSTPGTPGSVVAVSCP